MASMSYCRWQNILEDLRPAVSALEDMEQLREDEKKAMLKCVELFQIALEYVNEDE